MTNRTVKRAGFAFAALAIFGIGCYISYAVGYGAGQSHGYFRDRREADSANVPEKHRYEFKRTEFLFLDLI
jgi:hypothetical protein